MQFCNLNSLISGAYKDQACPPVLYMSHLHSCDSLSKIIPETTVDSILARMNEFHNANSKGCVNLEQAKGLKRAAELMVFIEGQQQQ